MQIMVTSMSRLYVPRDARHVPYMKYGCSYTGARTYGYINGKILRIKKGHIGIVEKEQETSWDIGVCAYVLHILYSECILECRDKPTSYCLTNFYTHGNNLIPISVPTHLLHKLAITDFSKETPQFYCPI